MPTILLLLSSIVIQNPFECPECVEAVVGPVVSIGGPIGSLYDSPISVISANGRTRAFSANQETKLIFDGKSPDFGHNNDSFLSECRAVNLTRSKSPSDLDYCGAWLNAAIFEPETGVVRGFYHEEKDCNYSRNSFTNKSIAYAESHDFGSTFTKPHHPNNAIILPPYSNTTSEHQTGEGDHGVVRLNSSYFLYFRQWDTPHVRVGLARASVKSGGVPGSWSKFFKGSFETNQNGLYGDSDAIANITGTAVYSIRFSSSPPGDDTYLVSLGSETSPSYLMPRLAFSKNGINWRPMVHPLLHTDGSWNR